MTRDWAAEDAGSDGLELAGAYMRLAYGGGYSQGLGERVAQEDRDD